MTIVSFTAVLRDKLWRSNIKYPASAGARDDDQNFFSFSARSMLDLSVSSSWNWFSLDTTQPPSFYIDDDDILFQTKSQQVMWTALPHCRPPPPSRGPTPRRLTPPAPPSSWTTRRQRVSRLDICLFSHSGLGQPSHNCVFFPWKYVNIVHRATSMSQYVL